MAILMVKLVVIRDLKTVTPVEDSLLRLQDDSKTDLRGFKSVTFVEVALFCRLQDDLHGDSRINSAGD